MSLFGDDDEITSDGGAFCGYTSEEKREMRARGEYNLDNYKPAGPTPGCMAAIVFVSGLLFTAAIALILAAAR